MFAPPFDVMDAGRMAVLQDPTGAVFQVWQAKKHIGAKILERAGRAVLDRAEDDANQGGRSVLHRACSAGRQAQRAGRADGVHRVQRRRHAEHRHDAENEHMPAHVPSYWMPYFQVADADASAAKVKELGGSVMVPPQDIPEHRPLRDRQRSAGRDVRGVQVHAENEPCRCSRKNR